MHYPCNYGYVPQTLSDDGDPVDVLVITPFPLVAERRRHLPADRRAARWRTRRAATPSCSPCRSTRSCRSTATGRSRHDMHELRLQQIQHFFEHYKDLEPGKWVKIQGWDGPEAARAEVRNGIASYAARSRRRPVLTLGDGSGAACRSLERQALGELVEVAVDAGAFAREEVVDRPRELRMREPVRRRRSRTGSRPRAILCSPCAPPSKRSVAVGDAPGRAAGSSRRRSAGRGRARRRPSSGRTRLFARRVDRRSASWRCARRRARR